MSCARGKERKAARELADVLREYEARMYADMDEDDMDALRNGPAPPSTATTTTTTASKSHSGASHDDIEAQIQQELASLQQPNAVASATHHDTPTRISVLDTDTECLCFLQCAPPVDAHTLAKRFLQDVATDGESRSRYVQRISPVRILCRADLEAIKAAATKALASTFPASQPRTYRIEPRIRAHTSLSRDVLIPLIASCVPSNADHRVDLAQPDVLIVVEVLRNVCGIGVLDEYEALGKWNVQTLATRQGTVLSRT
ncbi:RNA binding protein [Malassezia pachydermatis]